jgi:hypothetical protein
MASQTPNSKLADNKKGSFQQYRDQHFYIEISLYNQIKGEKPLYVPFTLVDSLKIHETIFEWATNGEIVFSTDFEVFARGSQKISSDPNTQKTKAPYIDRTDGRNRIHITIRPVEVTVTPDGTISEKVDSKKFDRKYWELNHDFVIVDVKDLPVGNAQRKKRMYIFIDERKQILGEKNLEWSSATIAAKKINKPAYSLKDSEAAMNPNEVLKGLLTIVSTNGDTMPKINVGFDDNGSIDKPNIPFDKIDDLNWDAGDPTNKVLFYPTANSNALDDLNYVLSHCISSDGFPVILDYGRNNEEKGWQLVSLSKYFEKATEQQVERIIIQDGLMQEKASDVSNTDSEPYIARADASQGTQTKNFTSAIASTITNYKFSPMLALDDNRIINSPLCYFDEHTGYFNLKKQINSVSNLLKKLKELANKGLYSFKNPQYKPQILLSLNKTKTSGQMTKNKASLNGPYSSQFSPLVQMIFDSLFLNQSLSFQTLGLTLRAPGKFVFIDRIAAADLNPFDDRFLGQWMIASVTHLFTQETYKTQVISNKIDSFSSLWPEEDDNY